MKERTKEKLEKIAGVGLTMTPLIEPIRQKLMVGSGPECIAAELVVSAVGVGILLKEKKKVKEK